ncbi:MAG: hypothetical protein LBT00_13130 [Spirochaetaceae bacterium]|nr:hypothetical protein [Spirochaetaceae bacterium]
MRRTVLGPPPGGERPPVIAASPLVIASGRHIAERSNPGRTPLGWIASSLTATSLPPPRNDTRPSEEPIGS